jgi:hypothetical protein
MLRTEEIQNISQTSESSKLNCRKLKDFNESLRKMKQDDEIEEKQHIKFTSDPWIVYS